MEVDDLRRVAKGLEVLLEPWARAFIGTNTGSPDVTEVGKKQLYPSREAWLKHVLCEIVSPLEGISHSPKPHGIQGHILRVPESGG